MSEKYKPTEADIVAAESVMTNEQRAQSDERETSFEKRRKQREALLATGIDQKARDSKVIQKAIERLKENRTSANEPESADMYGWYRETNPKGSEDFVVHLNQYPLIDLGSGEGGVYSNDITNKKILVEPFFDPRTSAIHRISHEKAIGKRSQDYQFPTVQRPDVFNSIEVYENVFHVNKDMLDFLTEVPDQYGNVTINHIDRSIINDDEYFKLVASQIERVLPDDGIVMITNADDFRDALLERGFIDVTGQLIVDKIGDPIKTLVGTIYIYQKPIDLIREEQESAGLAK